MDSQADGDFSRMVSVDWRYGGGGMEEAEFLENEQGEGSHRVAQEVFDDHLDEWELRIYKANRTHIQMPRRLEKHAGCGPKPCGTLERVVRAGSEAHL